MAPDDPDESEHSSVFGPGETVEEPGQKHRESSAPDVPEPKYQHEEWLYQQYVILEKTLQEIADDCGVREKTIWRWVQKFDIDTRSGGPRPGPWKDEGWLRSQYIGQQKSVYQIADEQDCDEKTIRNWLAEHGIEAREDSERHPASREERRYRNEEWLREQYVENEQTAGAIADECEVAASTIYDWLERHGIDTRSVAEARQLTEARSVRLPQEQDQRQRDAEPSEPIIKRAAGQGAYEGPGTGIDVSYQSNLSDQAGDAVESPYREEGWLREQYAETRSASEIAEVCDVAPETIYYWMGKHGIERTRGDENARYRDEDWLREAYNDLGTLASVADACDVSPGTIRNWLVRFGIDRNPDAISGNIDGGRPEKTLDDLLDALVELHERTGEWVGPSEYDEERTQLPSAPSTSWFYDTSPGGLSKWSDAVEMAKRRHS
jgi:transposase